MGAVSSSAMEMGALAPDFGSLYRQYFGFAWASLRRLGVSQATIDDAAQDLWVTVHRRMDALDPAASVKAWLFGIARRVASHYRRTERRHQRKLAAYSAADTRGANEPIKRREAALTMEAFLAKLDETKRVAFVLSEVEGWSAPEIARVVGTSPNTVYSRVRLARKQLRKHLSDGDSGLSADACVSAMRTATQPPPEAAKRCWLVLAPKLATTAAATAATSTGGLLAKLKLVGLGVALGGLGVVGLDASLPEPTPPPEPVAAHVAATAQTPTPEPPPQAPPQQPAGSPDAPPASAEAPPPPLAARIKPQPRSAPEPAPAPPSADTLAQETKLLGAAKKKLAAGDHAGAIASIRAHAQVHPDSVLADLRRVLEVQTICARGDVDTAQALAAEYAKRAAAATAEKLRSACK